MDRNLPKSDSCGNRKGQKRGKDALGTQVTHIGSDFTDDEIELLKAVDRFRTKTRRKFPTCRDMLSIIRELGYRKASQED